jgi:hypothetical protein
MFCPFRDETEGAEWNCSSVLLRAYEVKVDTQVASFFYNELQLLTVTGVLHSELRVNFSADRNTLKAFSIGLLFHHCPSVCPSVL